MKIRYLIITLIALSIILLSLEFNGLTFVLNRSDNEVTVSVVNENEKSELLNIFDIVYIGFPKIPEAQYLIKCRNSDKSTKLGYVTSFSSDWEEIRDTDLSC